MPRTNDRSRTSSGARARAYPLALMAASCATLFLASCKTPTRAEIDATTWLNNAPISADTCARAPELRDRGFYRRLNDNVCRSLGRPIGCVEFISFCSPASRDMIAIPKKDFERILNEAGIKSEEPSGAHQR